MFKSTLWQFAFLFLQGFQRVLPQITVNWVGSSDGKFCIIPDDNTLFSQSLADRSVIPAGEMLICHHRIQAHFLEHGLIDKDQTYCKCYVKPDGQTAFSFAKPVAEFGSKRNWQLSIDGKICRIQNYDGRYLSMEVDKVYVCPRVVVNQLPKKMDVRSCKCKGRGRQGFLFEYY